MLLDIGYSGRFWTFEKKVRGGSYTRVRLDRALANAEWRARFPLADLTHLTSASSDHSPILMRLNREQPSSRQPRPFRYEVMWEGHESWSDTINSAWTDGGISSRVEELRAKLQAISHDLGRWNNETFGNVRKEIKRLKTELEKLRANPSRTAPSHVELKINENLVELYHRGEILWRQRSRIEWLTSGDKNTRFFHLRASIRRKKNMIKALQNSLGVMSDDPEELKASVQELYETLYTS